MGGESRRLADGMKAQWQKIATAERQLSMEA
jgi:hypothetical protein